MVAIITQHHQHSLFYRRTQLAAKGVSGARDVDPGSRGAPPNLIFLCFFMYVFLCFYIFLYFLCFHEGHLPVYKETPKESGLPRG